VSRERRQYSREFKLAAVGRFEVAGNVLDLARELGVSRELLYKWHKKFSAGGAAAVRTTGRPRPAEMPSSEADAAGAADEIGRARRRIAELERKVGQQQLDIDFFRAALRHFTLPMSGWLRNSSTWR
jgi:transposase-like protein